MVLVVDRAILVRNSRNYGGLSRLYWRSTGGSIGCEMELFGLEMAVKCGVLLGSRVK